MIQYEKEQDPEYFSFKENRQDTDTSEKEKKYYAINTEEPQIEYDLSILSPKYSKITDNVNTSPKSYVFVFSISKNRKV